MIKNKKGTVFGVFLVMGMIAILISILIAFNSSKDKILIELDSPKYLYQLNSIKENFMSYAQDSAKLAIQQAFYDELKNIGSVFPTNCQAYQNAIILSDTCMPNQEELTKLFIQNLNTNYKKFIVQSPNYYIRQGNLEQRYTLASKFESSVNEDILSLNSPEEQINITRKSQLINYSYYISIPTEIKINLSANKIYVADLSSDIYTINQKAKECKGKPDINLIKACLNEVSLKNFNTNARIDGEYLILLLETKDNFFYTENSLEKFSKIGVNFAVKIA